MCLSIDQNYYSWLQTYCEVQSGPENQTILATPVLYRLCIMTQEDVQYITMFSSLLWFRNKTGFLNPLHTFSETELRWKYQLIRAWCSIAVHSIIKTDDQRWLWTSVAYRNATCVLRTPLSFCISVLASLLLRPAYRTSVV